MGSGFRSFAAVLVGAFWGTYKLFGTASYERAKAIGNGLGLNKSGKMLIEVAYGRMSPERLDAEMGEADDEYDDPQEFDDAQADEDEDDEKNPYRDF